MQLFTLVPGAIAPILFLRLREENSHRDRTQQAQKSLQFVWTIGLSFLLGYCLIDKQIILWLFGEQFLPSLQATRVLVLCSILTHVAKFSHTTVGKSADKIICHSSKWCRCIGGHCWIEFNTSIRINRISFCQAHLCLDTNYKLLS